MTQPEAALSRVLLAHPGTQYSHRLATQLQRFGCLHRFWTGFAWPASGGLNGLMPLLPAQLRARLANRMIRGVPAQRLRVQPLGEWRAISRLARGDDEQQVFHERNERFQQRIPAREIAAASLVVGFDTSSWLLAQAAQSQGRRLVLDQSIAHPLSKERVYAGLRTSFPDWVDDLPARNARVLEAVNIEHRLSHSNVVASSFTKASLVENGIDDGKIEVIPYGVDLDAFSVRPAGAPARPLRFLFLGSVNARKGVPLLCQAWQALAPEDAELWLVGPVSDKARSLIPALPGLRVMGKVAHRDLPALMQQCDVLVFPSYFEGFALVLLEAMAAGMPVITTPATAGPDLMTDGEQGFVVPTGDLDALVAAMRPFIEGTVDLPKMAASARQCAESYSWDRYGEQWFDLLKRLG